jgi:hypothetical protein
METNSTQGLAVFLFLLAFTFLGAALFTGGKLIFVLLFLVATAFSVVLFQKGKPAKETEDQAVRGELGSPGIGITKKAV